ncbi:MAG: mevalonate kinase, partial [Thermoplasmatota archaeon]
MLEASAPAKAILFGEHAVVYGKPAIAVSLDRRMTIKVQPGKESRVDGGRLTIRKHRYVRWAMENLWDGPPLDFRTRSTIPSASGLGSSAALSSSVVSILSYLKGDHGEELNARRSFEVEYNVQGGASPTDTSCSTHGSGILVSFQPGEGLLWSISKNERTWYIHHIDPPDLTMVIGYTRKPSITPIQVGKVRSYYQRSGFAKETVDEIGELVFDAMDALGRGDVVELGSLMDRNHSLLSILGVSSKELDKLRDAASPLSFGTKMTGAGGGGSIIALTERPKDVCEAIKRRGGVPYIVSPSKTGAEVKVTDEGRFVNFINEN